MVLCEIECVSECVTKCVCVKGVRGARKCAGPLCTAEPLGL